jgi:hypothetical protein
MEEEDDEDSDDHFIMLLRNVTAHVAATVAFKCGH